LAINHHHDYYTTLERCWMGMEIRSDFWQGQKFSLLHSIQTCPETHLISYSMGIGGLFLRKKVDQF
jgi:hypothetical protein